MTEAQVTLRIDKALWTQFRADCLVAQTSPTEEFAKWVAFQVAQRQLTQHIIALGKKEEEKAHG